MSSPVQQRLASLDNSNKLPLKFKEAGGVINLHYNNIAWPTTRPTNRADITVMLDAPAGISPPSWLLPTDRFDTF